MVDMHEFLAEVDSQVTDEMNGLQERAAHGDDTVDCD